jgi:GT2 family glycosyltransferase
MIINRETFENVGLLDEEYFFSGEIADFCQRVHKAGLMCSVFQECMAIHQPDQDSYARETLYNYYILRNRFLFIRKHFHYTRYFWYLRWIAGGTLQIILATMSGRRNRTRALWFGLRDGVMGRFGNRNDLFLS